MVSTASKTTPRTRYHHGDLRNALTAEAVELARAGGPDAVVLREVARRVGVSATAAYRHFATLEELLDVVKHRALDAMAEYVLAALARVEPKGDPGDIAVARFTAAGRGYLAFALEQRGLFHTAFCHTSEALHQDPEKQTSMLAETQAYVLLSALLDDLLATGRMHPSRRPGAETAAMSVVHGLAELTIDGPLRHLSEEEQRIGRERVFDVIVAGLTSTVPAADLD